jgi:DNA-binding MarR family transcriptional regulator
MNKNKTIGSEVRILSNLIHRWVENSPLKKQIERVTGSNAWIIDYVATQNEKGKDVFQKDFEEQFGITRSTASKVVNLMVQKGLIERESVPGDARLKKLVLTDRAKELHQSMSLEFKEIERKLSEGFTEEELNQFFDYIHRMQENMKND